jgi:hypothetical protein
MKIQNILLLLCSLVLISSCSVIKRHYRPGYSVEWKSNPADSKSKKITSDEPKLYTATNSDDSISDADHNSLTEEITLSASSDKTAIYLGREYSAFSANRKKIFNSSSPVSDCDIITLRNGTEVSGKVLEINPNEIRYKKCDNIEGPTIVVNRSEVKQIKYTNGITELINTSSAPEEEHDYYTPSSKPKAQKQAPYQRPNNGTYYKKINPFAIASLIAAIFIVVLIPLAAIYSPYLLILVPTSVVLGIIALREINANPEVFKGKGMAVFGIIFGGIATSIILFILLLTLFLTLII